MAGAYGELVETTLRVATWNIWWRFGPWEERQPAILSTLRSLDADIVCIQETWPQQAAEIAGALGMHHEVACGLETDGLSFGNAILSRWPITSSGVCPFPADPAGDEGRLLLRAIVDGPRGPVQVHTTHLNWRFDHSHIRQEQVGAICRFVADGPDRSYPPIVCGDFNADPMADEIRMMTGRAAVVAPPLVFHDAWEVAGDGPGLTWSNDNPYAVLDLEPARRIDYVFVGWPKAAGLGHPVRAALVGVDPVDGVVPSDHYGVVADLRY
jgi:endonuclease/exonuclease/phosphatase family metal-dependent hydrolase